MAQGREGMVFMHEPWPGLWAVRQCVVSVHVGGIVARVSPWHLGAAAGQMRQHSGICACILFLCTQLNQQNDVLH